MQDTLNALR